MKTPCVKICTMLHTAAHPEKICTGCYRTLREIAQWRQWPAEIHDAVLRELEYRRELLRRAEAADDH